MPSPASKSLSKRQSVPTKSSCAATLKILDLRCDVSQQLVNTRKTGSIYAAFTATADDGGGGSDDDRPPRAAAEGDPA